ncbi:hypothetical protein PHISP_07973 [Aspergillus sp. HF37]|nr:hypothetical protein PHISP_07973 [Aspergillus sp. HF37]
MSLKQEIETWVQALAHYDNQEFEQALKVFDDIADTSKILFNCGIIYATIGEHEKAVVCYQRAVGLDQYLAVAYFQEGVSNFLLGDFEEALANFNDTLLYLRGNTSIDYEQLGLKFRLFSCEVLFNRGLCYIYLHQIGPGVQDLEFAAREKVTPDHDVINEAVRDRAQGYTVFSIPVGVVYRPNDAKVKNLKAKDYLGKAKVIASAERSTAPASQREQRPSFSYETPNPGQKHAASRTRQHSEPPLNRNMFPPTPPPDASKASTSSSSGSLGRPGSLKAARPPRLDLDRPGANIITSRAKPDSESPEKEKPRIGTTRTASEPRGPGANQYGQFDREIGPQPTQGRMGHRRGISDTGYAGAGERAYEDEPHGMYNSARTMGMAAANGVRKPVRQRERYIDEDEEYHCHGQYPTGDDDPFHASTSATGGDFEPFRTKRRTGSPTRETATARRDGPDVCKFRVKVHAPEDTRYIIVGPGIGFGEFEGRIREKFGFRLRLRIRMQDDGDMITMVDQEDLDLLVGAARENAGREGSGMGKMEIWVEERLMI